MSLRQFVLTPEARTDLLEIRNYIAEDSFDPADQVVERLRLVRPPRPESAIAAEIWRTRASVRNHHPQVFRFWTVYSYIIAYRGTYPLEIVTIIQGARNLEAFLQNRIADSQGTEQQSLLGLQLFSL